MLVALGTKTSSSHIICTFLEAVSYLSRCHRIIPSVSVGKYLYLCTRSPHVLSFLFSNRVSDDDDAPRSQTWDTNAVSVMLHLKYTETHSDGLLPLTCSEGDLRHGAHGGGSASSHHVPGRHEHISSGQDQTTSGDEPAAPAAPELRAGLRRGGGGSSCGFLRCC